MAKIPFIQEGQRLQQGNPVPIGSSEDARAQGENIQRLGLAGQNAYLASLEVDRAHKDFTNKVEYEEADTAWKKFVYNQSIKYQDHLTANPTDDGTQAYNDFIDQNKDTLGTIAENSISDPMNRRLFKAKAEEFSLASAQEMGSMQRKRSFELKMKSFDNSNTLELEQVRDRGPGAIPLVMAKVVNNINSLPDEALPYAEKQKMIEALPKRMSALAVEGFYKRKDFQGARDFVESDENKKLYPPEGITKQLDDVSTEEEKILSRDHKKGEWEVQAKERKQKELQDKNDSTFLNVILNPNTSQIDRWNATNSLRQLSGTKAASHTAVAIAENYGKQVTQETSDDTMFEYGKRVLIDKRNLSTVDEDLALDKAKLNITDKDALRVLTWLKEAKNKKDTDPVVTKFENLVASGWSPEYMDKFDWETRAEKNQQKKAAILKYTIRVQNGDTPDKAARTTLAEFNKSKVYELLTGISPQDISDVSKIPEKLNTLGATYEVLTKRNDLESRKKAKIVLEEIKKLKRAQKSDDRDKRLEKIIKESSPPTTVAPKEPPTWWDSVKERMQGM